MLPKSFSTGKKFHRIFVVDIQITISYWFILKLSVIENVLFSVLDFHILSFWNMCLVEIYFMYSNWNPNFTMKIFTFKYLKSFQPDRWNDPITLGIKIVWNNHVRGCKRMKYQHDFFLFYPYSVISFEFTFVTKMLVHWILSWINCAPLVIWLKAGRVLEK